ncbi:hypothetical protein D3H65_21245 [Paraflavitalea soli]|uniref:Uncharacterized protein n=2 Tax=Paraflavitalea soli TaxID=2315862 RepID=A0A3B7MXF1_9BACT|nr:hypothetical protein D3H65_21245 [Paraflavitalea soli]
MRLVYLFIFTVVVALCLLIRGWIDSGIEKAMDIEVVRDGEEHLGNWAGNWPKGWIFFRLHRDGIFSAKIAGPPHGDTIQVNGSYDIVAGNNTAYYPRLIAVGDKKDTLFNYFIAYITPYDTKVEKVDKLVLSPTGIYDTVSYTFYCVKP